MATKKKPWKRKWISFNSRNNNMPSKSKYMLSGNRDEMINHIISECSKLAQKEYKARRVGKVIPWEICQNLKVEHTIKWYIQNPEFLLENKTHKVIYNFEIKKKDPPNPGQKTRQPSDN